MNKLLVLILILFSCSARADWRCSIDGEASEMKDNHFYACGVAVSQWEGVAREKARVLAQNEFISLCNLSTDCWKKHRTIDPGRTECKDLKTHFKCWRSLVFTLD